MKKQNETSFYRIDGAVSVRQIIIIGVSAIISLIFGLIINYLALPAQTIHSSGLWWFWIVIGIIFTISAFIAQAICNNITCDDDKPIIGILCGILTAVGVIAMFLHQYPDGNALMRRNMPTS